jgi:hypothetical protein
MSRRELSPAAVLVRREGEKDPIDREVAMQYALMFWADPDAVERLSGEERAAVTKEYEVLLEDPRIVTTLRLQGGETATSLRVDGGRTLMTDGPFADTKEVLGGLAVIEAADLDEVIALAERIPVARLGGAVEIRPVFPR